MAYKNRDGKKMHFDVLIIALRVRPEPPEGQFLKNQLGIRATMLHFRFFFVMTNMSKMLKRFFPSVQATTTKCMFTSIGQQYQLQWPSTQKLKSQRSMKLFSRTTSFNPKWSITIPAVRPTDFRESYKYFFLGKNADWGPNVIVQLLQRSLARSIQKGKCVFWLS